LLAASYAKAELFLTNLVGASPMAEPTVKHCSDSHCTEIGAVLTDTCKKNSWQEGHVVMVYDLTQKETCYCNCPSTKSVKDWASLNAKSFLPEDVARARALEVGNFRPLADEESKRWATDLINYHQNFYPEVEFHLKWEDNTVNAYAWRENGKKHVAILGGLVRYKSMETEGVAVVLAHELGHHYAGRDRQDYPLSCEGQADYEGVRDLMRKIWFGQQYIEVSLKGIPQLGALLGAERPEDPSMPNPDYPWDCSHPKGQCRTATYYAALSLEHKKPQCAGPDN